MTTYPSPAFEKGGTKVLGHRVTRLEDLPLVTGRGRFAADINFPRQLHMRIARVGPGAWADRPRRRRRRAHHARCRRGVDAC